MRNYYYNFEKIHTNQSFKTRSYPNLQNNLKTRSVPVFLFFQQNLVSQSPSAVRYSLSPFGPVFDGSSSLGALCSLKPCKKKLSTGEIASRKQGQTLFLGTNLVFGDKPCFWGQTLCLNRLFLDFSNSFLQIYVSCKTVIFVKFVKCAFRSISINRKIICIYHC